MRFLQILCIFALPLLLLSSCGNDITEVPKTKHINIEQIVHCSHIEQELEIKYSLEQATGQEQVTLSITEGEEWLGDVVHENKSIIVRVPENMDNERFATISLHAKDYASAKVRIKQHAKPRERAKHTLMFYFFGTSLNRYFSTNIEDAKRAIANGAIRGNNRVVYFRQRNASSGYLAELCYDEDYKVCFESIVEDNIAIEGHPINHQYISNILNKMSTLAPAERYGLVLAGHGTAWIPVEGAGTLQKGLYTPLFVPAPDAEVTRHFGENNVNVNISDIAQGISGSDIAIDYILFDACFMSNIESIYELRNSTNYIIASPCEIMGTGFPYERTLPHLFKDGGEYTDYDGAAKSYYLYYRDEFDKDQRSGSIAVYNCSEIEALRDATKEVVKSALEEYNAKSLQTYEGQQKHYFYDFGQWVNMVATDSAALEAFNTQLAKTVIAKYTLDCFYTAFGSYGIKPINVEVYSGVTTSAPSEVLNALWIETEWYKSVWQL